jgi:predicted transcriptional regulator
MSTRRPRHRGGAGGHEPRAVIESRAQRAWELDAAGRSQREIAAELGVSQAAVSKILARVADSLVVERQGDAARQRERLTNRLLHQFREALRAYERSQRDHTTRRQRQLSDANGTPTGTVVEATVTPRDGDPRFLEVARRIAETLATLNGWTYDDRRARAATETDPGAARDRVAGQLDRLAAAVGVPPVADKPE